MSGGMAHLDAGDRMPDIGIMLRAPR